jgi:tight adherence protein B
VLGLLSVLVFITTFVAVALAVLVAWFTLQRLGAEAAAEEVPDHLSESGSAIFKDDALSTISIWAKLLERFDFVEIMQRQLAQAGLTWSVGRLTAMMLLAGTVTLAVLVNGEWVPLWAAALVTVAIASLPYLYVLRRRAKRFRKFEDSFPDALESLARALRAGHPFAAAMEIVASEADPPLSAELRQAAIEGNLGTSWDRALHNLGERVPLIEVHMLASSVQLQSRTGGKLNEVLANLAETMRESASLKGEVRSLAAHGRLTGLVLTILPIGIAIIMTVVNPGYLVGLFQHPYGKYLIGAAVGCLLLAHLLIQRIVDIKI